MVTGRGRRDSGEDVSCCALEVMQLANWRTHIRAGHGEFARANNLEHEVSVSVSLGVWKSFLPSSKAKTSFGISAFPSTTKCLSGTAS